jgi:hypothetical protein
MALYGVARPKTGLDPLDKRHHFESWRFTELGVLRGVDKPVAESGDIEASPSA